MTQNFEFVLQRVPLNYSQVLLLLQHSSLHNYSILTVATYGHRYPWRPHLVCIQITIDIIVPDACSLNGLR